MRNLVIYSLSGEQAPPDHVWNLWSEMKNITDFKVKGGQPDGILDTANELNMFFNSFCSRGHSDFFSLARSLMDLTNGHTISIISDSFCITYPAVWRRRSWTDRTRIRDLEGHPFTQSQEKVISAADYIVT